MNIFLGAFLLCSVCNIWSLAVPNKKLNRISKPLLMPLLLCVYLTGAQQIQPLIAAAIVFGFLGDTFLLGTGNFFLIGLLAFLGGHLCYITAFWKMMDITRIIPAGLLFLIVYIVYAILVCRPLLPSIEKKLHPAILFYMLCLLAMSFSAYLGMLCGNHKFLFVWLGSLLFVASDSILAYQVFQKNRGPKVDVLIMVTYLGAQGLITAGML